MTNDLAWNVTLGLIALITAIFMWVLFNTSGNRGAQNQYEASVKKAYSVRALLFWIALIAGGVIAYVTLTPWPHPTRFDVAAPRVIQASGQQWVWQLSDDKGQVGETVEFQVSANDVNHGFGLYDPTGHLVAQVQAMPGYTNRMRYTFATPGEYKILCMEYCGVAHHAMVTTFKISPRAAN